MSALDEGYFGPDSVTWRLHADPLMAVAGLRSLFLQALHPAAMSAVAAHSTFREDPWGRLMRTGEYLGTVTYGTRADADRASARVRGIHRRVTGVDPQTGRDYRADDPDLLLWIHLGFVESNLSVVRRGGLRLEPGDADAYVREQVRAAQLLGLEEAIVPSTEAEMTAYYERVQPELVATEEARSTARFALKPPMNTAVALGTPARPAWAAVVSLAFATLPVWARKLYSFPGLSVTDGATTLGLRALRASLLAVPAAVREGPHLRAARARLTQSA
jgi:uncharacterized protein (DUF2236 family)